MRVYLTVRKHPSHFNSSNSNNNSLNSTEFKLEEGEKEFLADLGEEEDCNALNQSDPLNCNINSCDPFNTTTEIEPQQKDQFHSESTLKTTISIAQEYVGHSPAQFSNTTTTTPCNTICAKQEPDCSIGLFQPKVAPVHNSLSNRDQSNNIAPIVVQQKSEETEELRIHSKKLSSGKRKFDSIVSTTTEQPFEAPLLSEPSKDTINDCQIFSKTHTMGLSRNLGDYYSSQLKTVQDATSTEGPDSEEEYSSNPAASVEESMTRNRNLHRHSSSNMTLSQMSFAQKKNGDSDLSHEFLSAMKKRGLEVVVQEGDGNCLFRAVSLQVYGDSDSHMDIRRRCLDFMAKDEEHFAPFIQNEPFEEYIRRKRQNGEHGNNVEIQAISELFNRPVEVYIPQHGAEPINIFQSDYKTRDIPIRLSYHDGNHYNAVIDPLMPTAGLGLGLPNLEPGLADKLQMQQAVDESYQMHLQRIIDEENEKEIQLAIQKSLGGFATSRSTENSLTSSDYWSRKKAAVLGSRNDVEESDFDMGLECQKMEESSMKPSGDTINISPNILLSQRWSDRSRSASPSDRPTSETCHSVSLPSSSYASLYSSSAHLAENRQSNQRLQDQDEYPQVVQELVMNGFELSSVRKAYDLCGDNFDSILSFLISTNSNRL